MTKTDICNKDDVIELVNRFYNLILEDEAINYIFKNHMEISLEDHLPTMYDFWDSVLFGSMTYKGNPILKHILLNKKVSLESVHFEVWLDHWNNCIDDLFAGEKADDAKKRAFLMKELILHKIAASRNDNFIQ